MTQVAAQKADLRRRAFERRRALADRESRSEQILSRLADLPEYRSATTILYFIGVHSEVQTLATIANELRGASRIVVPWCDGADLRLFRLHSVDELAPGKWKIPEPKPNLRARIERAPEMSEVDLILVPGVAFDRVGRRLGHGQGYYDRLLADPATDAPLIAPAFHCQLFDRIPVESHDRRVDAVVTETETIRCQSFGD